MSKTKIMCVSSSSKYALSFKIKCHDNPLEWVDTYPDLGFELSYNCTFKVIAKHMMEKAPKVSFILKNLLFGSMLKPRLCL